MGRSAARRASCRGDRRTGVLEAEPVSGAAEGEQSTVGLDGADEAFEELADVLLDGHLLRGREELNDKLEEALGEVGDEPLSRDKPPMLLGWRVRVEELLARGLVDGAGRGGGEGSCHRCVRALRARSRRSDQQTVRKRYVEVDSKQEVRKTMRTSRTLWVGGRKGERHRCALSKCCWACYGTNAGGLSKL